MTTFELAALLAEHHVGGLDVAVDELFEVRFREGAGHRGEHAPDTRRRHGAADGHDVIEGCALEKLHCVVEDAVHGAAVVVHGHRVRVGEPCGLAHLVLEALGLALARAVGHQLHGRGAAEQLVARPVDDTHAALSEALFEHVLAELVRLADLLLKPVDRARDERRRQREGDHPRCGKLREVSDVPRAQLIAEDGERAHEAAHEQRAEPAARHDRRARHERERHREHGTRGHLFAGGCLEHHDGNACNCERGPDFEAGERRARQLHGSCGEPTQRERDDQAENGEVPGNQEPAGPVVEVEGRAVHRERDTEQDQQKPEVEPDAALLKRPCVR